MIYEIDCLECVGSGEIQNDCPCCETDSCAPIIPCPICKGARGFNLVVKCGDWKQYCYFAPQADCKLSCNDGYRPLTVDEVEWLLGELCISVDDTISINEMIEIIRLGMDKGMNIIVYKGQPVKLMPTWRRNEPSDSNNSTLT